MKRVNLIPTIKGFGCVLVVTAGVTTGTATRPLGCRSRSLDTARSRTIWHGTSSPCSATRRMTPMMAKGTTPNQAMWRNRYGGR